MQTRFRNNERQIRPIQSQPECQPWINRSLHRGPPHPWGRLSSPHLGVALMPSAWTTPCTTHPVVSMCPLPGVTMPHLGFPCVPFLRVFTCMPYLYGFQVCPPSGHPNIFKPQSYSSCNQLGSYFASPCIQNLKWTSFPSSYFHVFYLQFFDSFITLTSDFPLFCINLALYSSQEMQNKV